MKLAAAILAVLGSSVVSLGGIAGEIKVDFKVDGRRIAEVFVEIEGDIASARVEGETERFNLKEMSWLDPETNKWITLAECKEWAEQSRTKSLKVAANAPEKVRPFLLWSLEPTFKVEKQDDTVRLTSGQVDYLIEGQASKSDPEKFFRYSVLNAYKKAMTVGKAPPYSELKAIAEMKELGHIPRKMTVTMPGVPNSQKFEMEISETKP